MNEQTARAILDGKRAATRSEWGEAKKVQVPDPTATVEALQKQVMELSLLNASETRERILLQKRVEALEALLGGEVPDTVEALEKRLAALEHPTKCFDSPGCQGQRDHTGNCW